MTSTTETATVSPGDERRVALYESTSNYMQSLDGSARQLQTLRQAVQNDIDVQLATASNIQQLIDENNAPLKAKLETVKHESNEIAKQMMRLREAIASDPSSAPQRREDIDTLMSTWARHERHLREIGAAMAGRVRECENLLLREVAQRNKEHVEQLVGVMEHVEVETAKKRAMDARLRMAGEANVLLLKRYIETEYDMRQMAEFFDVASKLHAIHDSSKDAQLHTLAKLLRRALDEQEKIMSSSDVLGAAPEALQILDGLEKELDAYGDICRNMPDAPECGEMQRAVRQSILNSRKLLASSMQK